jgi:hypothetical protein
MQRFSRRAAAGVAGRADIVGPERGHRRAAGVHGRLRTFSTKERR